MLLPKIGLLVCGSNASNTGSLAAAAAMAMIRKFDEVGILSLPSLANGVPRQVAIARKIRHIVVVDGCKNSCAKNVAERLDLKYDAYLNIERDIGIKKIGPFSSLRYSEGEVERVEDEVEKLIRRML